MLFGSWQFIFLFLPAALLGFLLIPAQPHWPRKIWLTLVSLFFYGYWKIDYVPLLLVSIGANYTFAEIMSRRAGTSGGRVILALGVGFNLALLGYFKYTNFLLDVIFHVAHHEPARFDIILPLAISFFTFTQIGYLVDVSRDRSLHYGFLDYALFVVFFPHLIAGPIVRHWEIIPQYRDREFGPKLTDVQVGFALFLTGLLKKVLLADSVADYVANVFGGAGGPPLALTWFDAWLGTLAFALQIYFDFSGYSDMAIGLARLFGIKFPINFNSPYQAASIAEFWKRWHITLTRFLREYVYFPPGGNRCGPRRHMMNLMATMLLSGLWHGAGWTFVFWGGLHGTYLMINHRWALFVKRHGWPVARRWYRFTATMLTFLAVLFAWVFFKAPNLAAAGRMLSTMAGSHGLTMSDDVTNPVKTVGRFWQHLGIHFTSRTFEADYSSLFIALGIMFVLATMAPNSQELLAAHEPALEPVAPRGRLQLALGLPSGIMLGVGFFLVVRSFYSTTPSPFLYFNF